MMRWIQRLGGWLTCAFALIPQLADSAPAQAKCPPGPAPALEQEVDRVRTCLLAVARAPNALESAPPTGQFTQPPFALYSWGHTDKISDLLSMPAQDFKTKYDSQQDRADELRIRIREEALDPEVVWEQLVREARLVLRDASHLLDLPGPNSPDWQLDQQRKYRFAAYELIYPGFLDRLDLDPELEKAELERILAGESAGDRNVAAGRLLAHEITRGYNAAQWPSNQSVGNGLYLGKDPVSFLSHFQGAGIRCLIPQAKVIVDVHTDIDREQLPGILLPKKVAEHMAYNPTNYNQFVWPAALELAANGFILHSLTPSGHVWVSKGAIGRATCRPIRIEDFAIDCSWFLALNRPDNAAAKGYVATQSRNYVEKEATLFQRCGKVHGVNSGP